MATATQTPTRTAPLPPAALSALSRLESALALPHGAVRAVTRFEVAKARIAELQALPISRWSGANFNALKDAESTVKASREFLSSAGLLHLIEVDV